LGFGKLQYGQYRASALTSVAQRGHTNGMVFLSLNYRTTLISIRRTNPTKWRKSPRGGVLPIAIGQSGEGVVTFFVSANKICHPTSCWRTYSSREIALIPPEERCFWDGHVDCVLGSAARLTTPCFASIVSCLERRRFFGSEHAEAPR